MKKATKKTHKTLRYRFRLRKLLLLQITNTRVRLRKNVKSVRLSAKRGRKRLRSI